ncbi:hypothetical protein AB205_0213620 [Aquarana catesbeiana]|uniref:Uncharacterized protein n=1 Tax=Aquarana catesbeiana TaxID=8400 RepID=A0A2G9NC97_AQUCT|nr:hypothetical protein AB205_0213620 [Aquarana catesbeiana]
MFHIPFSGLKYLCAKYTFCFILIGEKRLRGQHSEDTRDPPHRQQDWEINPSPPRGSGGRRGGGSGRDGHPNR